MPPDAEAAVSRRRDLVRRLISEQTRAPETASAFEEFVQDVAADGIDTWLAERIAPDLLDARTLLRALGIKGQLRLAKATLSATPNSADWSYAVISSSNQAPPARDICCLSVDAMGGIEEALVFARTHRGTLHEANRFLVAAIGRDTRDLSALSPLVDGIVSFPAADGPSEWRKALSSFANTRVLKRDADQLSAEDVQGGVTRSEFDEVLKQSLLSDSDTNKRD